VRREGIEPCKHEAIVAQRILRPIGVYVSHAQGQEGTEGDAKERETGPLVPFPGCCSVATVSG
jgi:hypothetical protein